MLTIAVITGSLRKDSHNLKLAKAIEKLGGLQFTARHISIGDLPLFNQDLEGDSLPAVARMKAEIESADGVLFVTPEYNRSIPGVLKNAIDWASRPYGHNSFAGKPSGVIGTSPGAIGAAVAQNQLRTVVGGFLDSPVLGQPEVYLSFKDGMIAPDGTIEDASVKSFLQAYTDKFVLWVKAHPVTRAKAA